MGQAVPPLAILIVEDEPFVRYDLVDFFSDRGLRVFEAEDAGSAISTLETNPSIRIVLTDIEMPGSMDGLKLAHYVRHRYPPTILVIASGRVSPSEAELPERAMFVSKPFDPRQVLREIERMAA